jgi:hypothetical protein
MEFALEAVSRRCEVVGLGPQHVKDGRIRIERRHGSADVDIPLRTGATISESACLGDATE